jgi:hypothetical protein
MKATYIFLGSLALAGCLANPIEVQADDESSSSSDGGNTTFSSQSASVGTSVSVSSTSSADDGTSGETGTDGTTEGTDSGTTGEVVTDYALQFDGNSRARMENDGGMYEWTATDWTVEAWVEVLDESATGAVFDSQEPGFQSGWTFYLHPDSGDFVFSFIDSDHANKVFAGPSVEEIGVGWHHLAATKSGQNIYMFVDGVTMVADSVTNDMPSMDPLLVTWTIGAIANDNVGFNLQGVVVDDIRITEGALYESNFDPPVVVESQGIDTLLLLHMDEGAGVIVADPDTEIGFTIDNPAWVPGYY